MELKIHKQHAEQIGLKKFVPFGINDESWTWKSTAIIDLRRLSSKQREALRELLEANKNVRSVKMLLYDMSCYDRALSDTGSAHVRNIRMFTSLLQAYVATNERHHVYMKLTDNEDSWVAYYVEEIKFLPKEVHRDHVTPAHVTMNLVWEEFGGQHEETITWYNEDVARQKIEAILAKKGVYLETPAHRKAYEREVKRYRDVVPRVGEQFLCTGTATDDCDGNSRRGDSWYYRTQTLQMMREDGPSRVVVDIFYENDKEQREKKVHINENFWQLTKASAASEDEDSYGEREARRKREEVEEIEREEDAVLNEAQVTAPYEIPIHPTVIVFDLRRHLRLKTHLNNLTEYEYDDGISDKLVLPKDSKDLVEILIEHQEGSFVDIVSGKSGGAVVLLTGRPGTGKTLTAEVYAESEHKALYSVQASQLGTDPDDLESSLLKTLARARRWNAVMLLDEADVYIHKRGNDLRQNAIVGVFLRVLEYHSSILFLTTNRPDDVDDAVASRCVARIDYQTPTTEDQQKIWRILADTSNIKISDDVIDEIAHDHQGLSGRDVKNLLKLSALVASRSKKKITAETVAFVKKFKPTLE